MIVKCGFYDANIDTTLITFGKKDCKLSQNYQHTPITINTEGTVTFEAIPSKGSAFARWVIDFGDDSICVTDNPYIYNGTDDISIRAEGVSEAKQTDNILWVRFDWDTDKNDDEPFCLTANEWNRLQKYLTGILNENFGEGHGFIEMPVAPLGAFTSLNYNNVVEGIRMVDGYGRGITLTVAKTPYKGKILNDVANEINRMIKEK